MELSKRALDLHHIPRLVTFLASLTAALSKITSIALMGLYSAVAQPPNYEPIVISEDREILISDLSFDGKIVHVVNGAILTLQGEHYFRELHLLNGGRLTHQDANDLEGPTPIVHADYLVVDVNSRIDVSGKGMISIEDPSGPDAYTDPYVGASHGGRGGPSSVRNSDPTYGDYRKPRTVGHSSNLYERGGGAIHLQIEDLVVDGEISADGATPSWGGASGGSIWIQCNRLSGTGTIHANGSKKTYGSGSGGGGGRIALEYRVLDNFNISTQVQSYGGNRRSSPYVSGSAGTVYVRNVESAHGELRIDNTPRGIDSIPFELAGNVDDVVVVGNALLAIPEHTYLYGIRGTKSGGILNLVGDLETFEDRLHVDGYTLQMHGGTRFWSEVLISNGGILTHSPAKSSDDPGLELHAGYLEIDQNSAIRLDGMGSEGDVTQRTGASHGGRGGAESSNSSPAVYGDHLQPNTHGQGITTNSSQRGGGKLHLVVDDLLLDGTISANGEAGLYRWPSGGGGASGGSIWIEAGTIAGIGKIYANGGSSYDYRDTEYPTGGGAGGRIAVYFDNAQDNFLLNHIFAMGGYGYRGGQQGGAGSVYYRENSAEFGTIKADNGGIASMAPLELHGQINARLILNYAWVRLTEDTHLRGIIGGNKGSLTTFGKLTLDSDNLLVDNYYLELQGIVDQFREIVLVNGGALGHRIALAQSGPGLTLVADRVEIDETSRINVSGKGLRESYGTVVEGSAGASHGGIGGAANGVESNIPYGNDHSPITFGQGASDTYARRGGGAIKLVAEEVIVDGKIIANGNNGAYTYGETPGGGASGGSVWIQTDKISGTGYISANGGYGDGPTKPAGGGSGGRVAIYYRDATTFNIKDNIQVTGGAGRFDGLAGSDGSIYLENTSELLKISNVSPNYVVNAPVVGISITFNRSFNQQGAIDQYIQIGAPNGEEVLYSVVFPKEEEVVLQPPQPLAHPGTYIVSVSPGITTPAGTPMDQDGDTIPGEPTDDHYVFTFTIDAGPPGTVTPAVAAIADGSKATLDWTSYDQAANGGDIQSFRIYRSSQTFTNPTSTTLVEELSAGTTSYQLSGLQPGVPTYVAVVAVDELGNALDEVSPVVVITQDQIPPGAISNPQSISGLGSIHFQWNPPTENAADLASYRVRTDAGELIATLSSGQTEHLINGLAPGSVRVVRVSAVDHSGNESVATRMEAVTWLPNPSAVQASPGNGSAEVQWQPVAPAQWISSYRVYVSQTPFDNVSGMTQFTPFTSSPATLSGLTNEVDHYVAIVTENTSGGFNPEVSSVRVRPSTDLIAPQIDDARFDTQPISAGQNFTHSGLLSVTASDNKAVVRVEAWLGENPVGITQSSDAQGRWSIPLSLDGLSDGPALLRLSAFDIVGNSASVEFPISIALAPPNPPILSAPATGTVTADASIQVQGLAAQGAEVRLLVNELTTTPWLALGTNGQFTASVPLTSGDNRITARVRNRAGESLPSAAIIIERDDSRPGAPLSLVADPGEAGTVQLRWVAPADGTAVGYDLYRAGSPFANVTDAIRVNANRITENRFDDLPVEDGIYYYRVVAYNSLGTPSEPSNAVSATADGTLPTVTTVAFTSAGAPYDSAGMRYGAGKIDVNIELSEPLEAPPYLNLALDGFGVIPIAAVASDPTHYLGKIDSLPQGLTGTASLQFSGRDLVGNRGSAILAPAQIQVDTRGPRGTSLTLIPASPIRNYEDAPVTVSIDLILDEAPASGTTPQLGYNLFPGSNDPLGEIPLLPISATHWQGELTLPGSAGKDTPQILGFSLLVQDDLGNQGTELANSGGWQIYQDELPPLDTPQGFSAKALPAGKVELRWNAVEGALAYQLYRQSAAGSADAFQRVEGELTLIDQPGNDGPWSYSVASIRSANGQESTSAQSPAITVQVDSQAPDAPQQFSVLLHPAGIVGQWQTPAATDIDHYRYYRAAEQTGPGVNADLVLDQIVVQQAVDSRPDPTKPVYFVTAVDKAGNESSPSNYGYLNTDLLLPVQSLHVERINGSAPSLSWQHNGNHLAGYNLYLGNPGQRIKLNDAPYAPSQWTDLGYSGGERRYTIEAVDANGEASPARSLLLPELVVTAHADQTVRRGLMNQRLYRVENRGAYAVQGIHLELMLADRIHRSEIFSLLAGETADIPLTIGGYPELPDTAAAQRSVVVEPEQGLKVTLTRAETVDVRDGGLGIELQAQNLLRGAIGQASFVIENFGNAELQVVLARNNGANDSNDVSLRLLDDESNPLTVQAIRLALGDAITTDANGISSARIAPGQRYRSPWIDFPIPAAAPQSVELRLDITRVHHELGTERAVTLSGGTTRIPLNLVDTEYRGHLDTATPEVSFGELPIVLTGRALRRTDDAPMAYVPLTLILERGGLEERIQIETDAAGRFSHRYTPNPAAYGRYRVSVLHPDLTERPEHGAFVLQHLDIQPRGIDVDIPRHDQRQLPITLVAGEGTELAQVHLALRAEDQAGQTLPAGIEFNAAPATPMASGQRLTLRPTLVADDTAPEAGTLILAVLDGQAPLGAITVNYHFGEALPRLSATPLSLELGLTGDEQRIETVRFSNTGLATLEGLTLELRHADGSPAPAWTGLTVPAQSGNLAVGESREVGVRIQPAGLVPSGQYVLRLRAEGANHPPLEIPLTVRISESGRGDLEFKLADMYTGLRDPDTKEIHQGLAGAEIEIRHDTLTGEVHRKLSDSLGEARFENLPAGRYHYRVSAPRHLDATGLLRVQAELLTQQPLFLDYRLVSVEWQVREIVLEDRYDLVLNLDFEADLPAAVVVVEPSSVPLPLMRAGESFQGELKITNHGLVRADELELAPPPDSDLLRFEFGPLPDTLGAKQSLTIPYRITALQDFEPDGEATGAGCYTERPCSELRCSYVCANGDRRPLATPMCWVRTIGTCSGGATASGGDTIQWGHVSGDAYTPPWVSPPGDGQAESEPDPLPACRVVGKICEKTGDSGGLF